MASNGFILSVHDLERTPLVERHVELPIRLGRSSLNDVTVAHRLVSEFHARVEHVDGRLCVRDLHSKNGVLVESFQSADALRVEPQIPVDLEPYGYEFLLSPVLRVRVRPASAGEAVRGRQRQAIGSVLGSSAFAPASADAEHAAAAGPRGTRAEPASWSMPTATPRAASTLPPLPWSAPPPDKGVTPIAAATARGACRGAGTLAPVSASPAALPYASMFVEPASAPLELPAVPNGAYEAPWREVEREPPSPTQVSRPSPRGVTLLEPGADVPLPAPLAPDPWQLDQRVAAAVSDPAEPLSHDTLSLEALALRGLRELAASLLPGQAVENASDVVQLVTKVHDALEMFCRCFIPVREACSRFSTPEELERSAVARCQSRSGAYLAVDRALDPAAVAAALLDWREPAQDAPLAVEHILADSMLQQLTTLHAALDGTSALLEELSPARIEARAPRSPSVLSRLGLAGAPEKLAWALFVERHQELASAGAVFRELFGDAFSRLHEASRGSGSPPP